MGRYLNLIGEKFGRWTVLEKAENKEKPGQTWWKCQCSCSLATIRLVPSSPLIRGKSLSCGCRRHNQDPIIDKETEEIIITYNKKTDVPRKIFYEHNLWTQIKARCFNPKSTNYKNYGARGITMYDDWKNNFETFLNYLQKTIGLRPSTKHSLDRINNNGHYAPGNLRWATRNEQNQNNRRTKLTVEKVIEILTYFQKYPDFKHKEHYLIFAKKFKIHYKSVYRIVKGIDWKNIYLEFHANDTV